MNVSLTAELEKFIADKVATGRYTSASEVVREALRLLEWEEMSRKEKIEEFNRELKRRTDALDRGDGIPGEVFRQEVAERLAARRKRIA